MPGSRATWLITASALSALALASCAADQPPPVPLFDPPGFWRGLWHGFIAPVTFLVSLFSDDVRIYAFPDAGPWYDFGFMSGISGFSVAFLPGPGNGRGGEPCCPDRFAGRRWNVVL